MTPDEKIYKAYYEEGNFFGRDALFHLLKKTYPRSHPSKNEIEAWLQAIRHCEACEAFLRRSFAAPAAVGRISPGEPYRARPVARSGLLPGTKTKTIRTLLLAD